MLEKVGGPASAAALMAALRKEIPLRTLSKPEEQEPLEMQEFLPLDAELDLECTDRVFAARMLAKMEHRPAAAAIGEALAGAGEEERAARSEALASLRKEDWPVMRRRRALGTGKGPGRIRGTIDSLLRRSGIPWRSMDRTRADWLHYRGEAALAANLTDRERWAAMRDLYEMYLAFQRTKSPEQIIREIRADWRLNPIRPNSRYLQLRNEAAAAAGGPDAPPDAP